LRKDAETKALVTDVLWGATLVSAAVTTVLFLISNDNANHSASAERGLAQNTQHLELNLGPSGIAVDGRF
jgi:hypothetical protein